MERVIAPALGAVFLASMLVVRLLGAGSGVPIPAGDQIVFLPVAYEWSSHGRFEHPFWTFPGASSSLYNWHGWLYPIVLSWFPTTREPQTVLLSATVLALLSLGTFVVYARIARLRAAEAAALLVPLGAIVTYQIGRPESLLSGLWGVGLALERTLPGQRFDAAAAALLGLGIVTQPVVSVAALLVFVLYAACTDPDPRASAARAARVAGGALLVALVLTAVCSPLSLGDWLRGLRANAEYVASRAGGGVAPLVHYFLLEPSLPVSVIYLALGALSLRAAWRGARSPGSRCLAAGASLALVAFVTLMALRVPATVYNLVALAPPILAVALRHTTRAAMRVSLGAALVAASASLALGCFTVLASSRSTSLADLQAQLRALSPCALAPDASSWLAAAGALGEAHLCRPGAACPARLLVQANTGLLEPPAELDGLALAVDDFQRHPPSVGGLALGRTSKAYAHALYGELSRCDAAPARTAQEPPSP
jgi:hypothetical protein